MSAMTARFEHIPPELAVHVLKATAFCAGTQPMIETALVEGYALDAERITLPRPGRVGHGGLDFAVAVDRRALPARVAAARRLGRA